ncbi:MAG: FAD-dependent oxidoreductase [Candidatus Helarchaeota archaeon]
MNDLDAFKKLLRSNFSEIEINEVFRELNEYVEKCLQCKKPKCIEGCPHCFNIPDFIKNIKEQKFDEALKIYYDLTPFPITLSIICPHTCEETCVLSKKDKGVPISRIKEILSKYLKLPDSFFKKEEPKNKSIAIIGSGPAGLKSATILAKKGYDVTIYEMYEKPGGMLILGIPDFRLPRDILNSEIDNIKRLGVKFILNTEIDAEKFHELKNSGQYAMIVIAIGAHEVRKMNIKGEDSPDVIQALNFLKNYNLGKKIKVGKKVAVIGGGNVAFDAARVAKRLGAEVSILYRRSKNEMPGSEHELQKVIDDGIDIQYLTNPVEILVDNHNRVIGLKLVRMRLGELDKSGRPRPIPIEGSEFERKFDTVIEAIGQRTSLEMVLDKFGLKDQLNDMKIEDNFASGDNILIIGDCFTGPSTVIESIKSAADGCQFLLKCLEDG